MNNRPLILLVGKSGSGKTSVAEYLEKHYGLTMLESYTTRPPRHEGEKGHIFATEEDYDSEKHIAAETFFHEHHYWATEEQCNNAGVYVIDPDGIKSFRLNYHGGRRNITIYLKVNPFIRFFRMVKRGDGIINALKRIVYDVKKFDKFEKHPAVHIVKRDTIANVASTIFNKVV